MSRFSKVGFISAAFLAGLILSSLCGCAACRKIEIKYKSVAVAIDLENKVR